MRNKKNFYIFTLRYFEFYADASKFEYGSLFYCPLCRDRINIRDEYNVTEKKRKKMRVKIGFFVPC